MSTRRTNASATQPSGTSSIPTGTYASLDANGIVPITQLPAFPPPSTVGQGTYLASGGNFAYTGGLSFSVGAGVAYIDFTSVPFAAGSLTLGAANATNPRFDALVVGSNGALSVVAGTAAATPSYPDLDQVTQLALTYVLVPALAVSLAITTTDIYKENTEWTSSVSGGTVNAASTNNPFAGTKDVEFTAAASGAFVRFTNGAAISLNTARQVVVQIRSKAAWAAAKSLQFTWYLAGVKVGQSLAVKTGAFGFNSSTTASYQQVVLPIASFLVPVGATVDRFEAKVNGSGATIGLYLDNVVLESTSSVTVLPPPTAKPIVENDIGPSVFDAGNTSTAITIDWAKARAQRVTATGNFTVTHLNAVIGLVYTLEVLTGAGGFTGAFASTNFGTTPTLTATASKLDIFTFYRAISGTMTGAVYGQGITP